MAEHLSAAQVTAIEAKIREAISQAVAGLNLRKYAIQVALDSKAADPLATARLVYEFLTGPASEIVVRIEQ